MVLVAGCLGLRVSEIVALQWGDFDFPGLTLLVNRSIVHGRIGEVKTEYSRDSVPLDPALVEALMQHKKRSISTPEGWLFANPVTRKPYHQEEIQKRYIRKAGIAAEELMRHASIQTTMNVYGKAMTDTKRQAHRRVVEIRATC